MTSRGITEIYSNGLIRGSGRKQGGGAFGLDLETLGKIASFIPKGLEIGQKLTDEVRKRIEKPKPMTKSGSGKKKKGKGKK